MNLVEIVALVVAGITTALKLVTANKEFWQKIPVLAHYLPGLVVVLTLVGEKLMNVQTTNDAVNAVVALALLAYGHFTKPKKPVEPTPPVA